MTLPTVEGINEEITCAVKEFEKMLSLKVVHLRLSDGIACHKIMKSIHGDKKISKFVGDVTRNLLLRSVFLKHWNLTEIFEKYGDRHSLWATRYIQIYKIGDLFEQSNIVSDHQTPMNTGGQKVNLLMIINVSHLSNCPISISQQKIFFNGQLQRISPKIINTFSITTILDLPHKKFSVAYHHGLDLDVNIHSLSGVNNILQLSDD